VQCSALDFILLALSNELLEICKWVTTNIADMLHSDVSCPRRASIALKKCSVKSFVPYCSYEEDKPFLCYIFSYTR
jgi:hypothetical protein